MMAYVQMRVDVHRIFMFMAMNMHQVICLKQRQVIKDIFGQAGFNDFLFLAENMDYIGDLLNNMQIVGSGYNRLAA